MKKLNLLILFLLSIFFIGCTSKKSSDVEVEELVKEAYIQLFPIVENYKGIYFYGVEKNSPQYKPMNTVVNDRKLYSPDDTFVVSPNNDTYYSTGILDLRAEPVIFKVPASADRYYVFQLVDMVTNNFGYIGTNKTGKEAGIYAITSPNFDGKLPDGVKEIKAPSEFIVVAGRTAVNAEDPADIEKAKQLQDQFQIGVISKFYPDFVKKEVNEIDFPALNPADIETEKFFGLLNFLLQYTKLSTEEQAIVDKYKAIGVEAGKPYTFYQDHPELQPSILKGIETAKKEIDALAANIGKNINGWGLAPVGDYFGKDYTLRTAYAKKAIYVNSPDEAYYPAVNVDNEGNILDGNNNYVINFTKDQIPPAKFFWSITMYDNAKQLLVHNEIKRYSIGDRTKGLVYNNDGSLTIYIGSKKPDQLVSNWLPAPKGGFNLMMRIYGPEESVIKGTWNPPAVEIIK